MIEIERLNGIIIEKQEECEDLRLKFNDMTMQFKNLKEMHIISV